MLRWPAARAAAALIAPVTAISSVSLCASHQAHSSPNTKEKKCSPELKTASASATAAVSAGASALLIGTAPAAAGVAAAISAAATVHAVDAAVPLLLRWLPAHARPAVKKPSSSPIAAMSRAFASQSQQVASSSLAFAPSLTFVVRSIITPVPPTPPSALSAVGAGMGGRSSRSSLSSKSSSHRASTAAWQRAKQPRCSPATRKRRRVTVNVMRAMR